MRFVCDQHLDAAVASMLRKRGHEAWTVASAGLSEADDDDLTIYAQQQKAALITHDSEFSERRRKNVVGQHIYLKCKEWDAAEVLDDNLDEILAVLAKRPDIWIRLSPDAEYKLSFKWE